MTLPVHLQMVGARDAGFMESKDFYESVPEATRALLEWWTPTEPVWECACGKGAISELLKQAGVRVVSTDLVNRGYGFTGVDFLKCDGPVMPGVDTIITNPPYNIATEFMAHACKIARRSVFLMPVGKIEGIDRYELVYSKGYLSHLVVFYKRLPRMHRPDYTGERHTSTMAFAWFFFGEPIPGKPPIDWIRPI